MSEGNVHEERLSEERTLRSKREQKSSNIGSSRSQGVWPFARTIFLQFVVTFTISWSVIVSAVAAGEPDVASQPGYKIEVLLTRGITEAKELLPPATEFPEDIKKIYAVVMNAPRGSEYKVSETWIAVNAEGIAPNKAFYCDPSYPSWDNCRRGSEWLQVPGPNQPGRFAVWLQPPIRGFSPGDYRIDLKIGEARRSVEFKITPIMPPAALVESTPPPRGLNVALANLGGRIESATSQSNDKQYAARNLIDGFPTISDDIRDCQPSCGWLSKKDDSFPQDIVFSFHQGREALITAVIIDTPAFDLSSANIAKHVELWASTTSPAEGFTRIARARLHRRPTEQLIVFSPTRAKYLKLRILSIHAGSAPSRVFIGEVKIIEAADKTPSILSDMPKNLALPALGGAIVKFTSRTVSQMDRLVDDSTDDLGWVSNDDPLPQEVVFAFRGDQVALVDRIVLNPNPGRGASRAGPETWPKLVSVLVSIETPFDGFHEVGQFTLVREPREQAFPINQRARFVKLRILENFGGKRTSLGEVKLIEGSAPGYDSILLTPEATTASRAAISVVSVDETGIAVETEPNNTPAEANPLALGLRTKGMIDPIGEKDHFKLSIPGAAPSVLTLELLGRPYIRASLTLLDPAGNVLKVFDPNRVIGHRAEFSWSVKPGDNLVRLTEPPISIVLIWDTSGSMDKESVNNLNQAVAAYLDQVQPSERLNLIRFSGGGRMDAKELPYVEVLLSEFTNDKERLKAAIQGKFFSKGGTPFYDAVKRAMELLEGVQGNRAIVVMTDGIDTTSKLDYPGFWRLLEEKRIRLYTIGLGMELPIHLPDLGTSGTRFLTHSAMATNGRFFFARTPEELKGVYQQIADELRTPSTYYLRPTLSQGPGNLSVMATGERIAAVSAPPQIELILDASGSMREQKKKIDGRLKIDVAKDVMVQIIESLPEDIQVALRVYGHRIHEGKKGDCQDSELVFPFAKIDKPRLIQRVRGIQALGTTPIAYSLQQVARDFGNAPGEKMVILVTDGKEECKGNPQAAVSDLLAKGIKMKLNIVGLALADEATKKEMQRIAGLTGGQFYDAKDTKGLRGAIEQALSVPYDVLDGAGDKIAGGITGQSMIPVPEGVYTVVVAASGKPVRIPNVRIAPNKSTKVELKKEGKEIGTRVVGP